MAKKVDEIKAKEVKRAYVHGAEKIARFKKEGWKIVEDTSPQAKIISRNNSDLTLMEKEI